MTVSIFLQRYAFIEPIKPDLIRAPNDRAFASIIHRSMIFLFTRKISRILLLLLFLIWYNERDIKINYTKKSFQIEHLRDVIYIELSDRKYFFFISIRLFLFLFFFSFLTFFHCNEINRIISFLLNTFCTHYARLHDIYL